MITKAIILAGGTGKRLSPITKSVNKQLLPLFDKPMIFYPLSVLMLAKIRDILIVTNKKDIGSFSNLFGNGKNLGIKISYLEQQKANGLPEAFIIGEKFINKKSVALILGDNFFYGQGFTKKLSKNKKLMNGCKIFLYKVKNPQDYGTAEIKKNKINIIKEKPKKSKSGLAITGLYFFDKKVVEYSKKLKLSKRNELEITDLLNIYRRKNQLSSDLLGRGGAWLDTGSIEDFYKTSAFVSAIENRQGFKIACLEEIALGNKWITRKNILSAIKFYGNCGYSNYLKKLI